jgi:hypothetical protein
MKTSHLIKLIVVILVSSLQGEDMQKYLQETVRIAKEGNYEEALERHVWFHDHALEHQPSMMGVRLSFALSYWTDLGNKYPPALEKLKEIRDAKEGLIKQGKGSFELFHDVTSINRELGEEERSLDLFKIVEGTDSEQTDRLWIVIKDTAFKYKDYELVNRYIGDIEQEYRSTYSDYLRDFGMFKDTDHIKWVKDRFRAEAGQLIELSKINGDEETASRIKDRVSKVLQSKDVLGETDVNLGSNAKIMIKCRDCGQLNEEDSKFCQECGGKL